MVIVKTIIFFIIAVVGGFVIFKLFLALDKRYPHVKISFQSDAGKKQRTEKHVGTDVHFSLYVGIVAQVT